MGYPYQSGPGLTNSYAYGQNGQNNPLYANNYDPNAQYTYGQPFAGSGLQGVNYGYNQPMIQQAATPYSSTPYYQNTYQYSGQAGYNPGAQPNNMGQSGNVPYGEAETGAGAGNANSAARAGQVAAGVGTAVQTAQTVAGITQDFKQASEYDVDKALPVNNYHPRSAPPAFVKQEVPEEISKGTGGRAALKYAGQGAATGAAIGSFIGPWGTAIGAGIGAIGGAIVGAFKGKAAKKKRKEFERKQAERESEYRQALGRYYDIQNNARIQGARQQHINQRSQPVSPMYGASIYGIGNY